VSDFSNDDHVTSKVYRLQNKSGRCFDVLLELIEIHEFD